MHPATDLGSTRQTQRRDLKCNGRSRNPLPEKGAREFLDALDRDEAMRAALKVQNLLVEFGKAHGFQCTVEELNRALEEKWGKPSKRELHPESFTCPFSEPPLA